MRYQLTARDREFCELVVAAGFHAAKYHTFALVEDCLAAGVPGDFAECGVLFGAHPAIMLYVLKKHGIRDRKVHLFDSFQGISRATAEDCDYHQQVYGLSDGAEMRSSGISVSPVENTRNNLAKWGVYDPDIVCFHPGWFEETLERDAAELGALAILRVDVDLYSPSLQVFKHLYPHVSPGGFICNDDYGTAMTDCRRAMESVIGPQEVIAVEGQETTSWWRKQ